MGRVDGKVVLISGGARGMGAEAVGLLARAGARVVSGDILDDLSQQVEADQGPAPGCRLRPPGRYQRNQLAGHRCNRRRTGYRRRMRGTVILWLPCNQERDEN